MRSERRRRSEQPSEKLHGRQTADAVVIGGGFAGLHIALWLAKAGLRVTLLEAETIGFGSSSRCAGMATALSPVKVASVAKARGKDAASACVQTYQAALRALRTLADSCGWRDEDAYWVANGKRSVERLQSVAASASQVGMPISLTQTMQCPFPCEAGLLLHAQGTLNPMGYLQFLTREAASQGVRIHEHSRVVALESSLALTHDGSVAAPFTIIATDFPILNTPGWYFTRLLQRQWELLPLDRCAPFEGMYFAEDDSFAIRRLRGGAMVRQSGPFASEGGDDSPLQRYDRQYGRLIDASLPERCYAAFETFSADGLPFIGAYSPKLPNVFVATGFGGNGLVGGVLAAQAVSARILGLPESSYELYEGTRSRTANDGRLLLRQVGAYLRGELHPHAPRCPHLGCRMIYRAATSSWICPCHGSTFDDIGQVRTAPAVKDATIRRGE